ncbi:hypothetical protein MJO28_004060 [Puccinia striiformis f. sp. tritici]|uniref:Uncharacterized protein n=1 Tax=Puccinia striiformis f. sp. tritici TaxID=168172 RepID=A0ACC0EPE5_9BASI|nr:hypothetical protein MJO28_004060 [Puccinia striiformis f. sp. tritici]
MPWVKDTAGSDVAQPMFTINSLMKAGVLADKLALGRLPWTCLPGTSMPRFQPFHSSKLNSTQMTQSHIQDVGQQYGIVASAETKHHASSRDPIALHHSLQSVKVLSQHDGERPLQSE